ncbi:MAG: hypothetical protein ABSA94_11710, partial [Acidobacteriaceae bacterium]
MRKRIVGIAPEGAAHRFNGLRILAVLDECIGVVEEAVELRCLGIDLLQAALRNIQELGDVDGTIGRGGVLDHDGGRIMALSIDV